MESIVVKSRFQTCCPRPNLVAVPVVRNPLGESAAQGAISLSQGDKNRTSEDDAAECQRK